MDYKQEFIDIYKTNITRHGSEKLLAYLDSDKCDFFTAPASTRYHLSQEGGLCRHSVNVYHCLKNYLERERVKEVYGLNPSEESIAVMALLHDLCKINMYVVSMRNSKNEVTGQWEKVPYYTIDDKMPYGHGEKSVYLAEHFMKLTHDEAFAIRWHMGFSGEESKVIIGNALNKYPLAVALHIADMESTFFVEK